jgi:hypothetical protein
MFFCCGSSVIKKFYDYFMIRGLEQERYGFQKPVECSKSKTLEELCFCYIPTDGFAYLTFFQIRWWFYFRIQLVNAANITSMHHSQDPKTIKEVCECKTKIRRVNARLCGVARKHNLMTCMDQQADPKRGNKLAKSHLTS